VKALSLNPSTTHKKKDTVNISTVFFFFQNLFDYPSSFPFLYKLRISLMNSAKISTMILVKILIGVTTFLPFG
jgi:hypothetical protein